MRVHNTMQYQALRDNYAHKIGISPNFLDEYYMAERFVHRVSLSRYKDNFVFKGGFILSSLLGVDIRRTKDIDSALIGIECNQDYLEKVIREICDIQIDDMVTISFKSIGRIVEEKGLNGFRVKLVATMERMRVPFSIDIVEYDEIKPTQISYEYPMMFDNDYIPIMAYGVEAILTEKIDAVLVNGTGNTRMRDYYDINTLFLLYKDKIDKEELKSSLIDLFKKQKNEKKLSDYKNLLDEILHSEHINKYWANYQSQYSYVESMSLDEAISSIRDLLDWLFL